eukprot:Nk52_evm64s210 gene=Nk52_evmTU64s210
MEEWTPSPVKVNFNVHSFRRRRGSRLNTLVGASSKGGSSKRASKRTPYFHYVLGRELGIICGNRAAKDALIADLIKICDEQSEPLDREDCTTICMDFNCSGQLLASGHSNRHVKIWNVHSKKLLSTLHLHGRTVWSVKFHPTKEFIAASGCLAGQLKVFNAQSGEVLLNHEFPSPISSIEFWERGESDPQSLLMVSSGLHIYQFKCNQTFAQFSKPVSVFKGATFIRMVKQIPKSDNVIVCANNFTSTSERRKPSPFAKGEKYERCNGPKCMLTVKDNRIVLAWDSSMSPKSDELDLTATTIDVYKKRRFYLMDNPTCCSSPTNSILRERFLNTSIMNGDDANLNPMRCEEVPILRVYNAVMYSECSIDTSNDGQILAICLTCFDTQMEYSKKIVALVSLQESSMGSCLSFLELKAMFHRFTSLNLYAESRLLAVGLNANLNHSSNALINIFQYPEPPPNHTLYQSQGSNTHSNTKYEKNNTHPLIDEEDDFYDEQHTKGSTISTRLLTVHRRGEPTACNSIKFNPLPGQGFAYGTDKTLPTLCLPNSTNRGGASCIMSSKRQTSNFEFTMGL